MRLNTLGVTIFALFCGLMASNTEAAAQASGTSTLKTEVPKPVEKPWNVTLDFQIGSTLHKQDSYERRSGKAFSISPIYRLSENWSLAGNTALVQDDSIEGQGNSFFDNTSVSLGHSYKINSNVKWKNSVGGVLPTNSDMRDQTTYQGSVKASTGLNFSGLALGSSVNTGLTLTRNFHAYNINADGGFNVRESAGLSIGLDLPFAQTWSFGTSFMYNAGRAYSDDLRTKFAFEAGISWAPTDEFALSVGTSNTGSALKLNGRDSSIEFFDNNSSAVKLGLTYTL